MNIFLDFIKMDNIAAYFAKFSKGIKKILVPIKRNNRV